MDQNKFHRKYQTLDPAAPKEILGCINRNGTEENLHKKTVKKQNGKLLVVGNKSEQ